MDQHVVDMAQGLGVRDLLRVVDRRAVQIGGHAGLADPLGDGTAAHRHLLAFHPVVERAALRVGQHDPHAGLAFLQGQRHAGQGAAGAAGAGEGIDRAAGLLPDFRSGAGAVAFPIRQVVELVGPERAGFLGQPARDMHVVARVAVRLRRHQPQVGADHAQEVDLLFRLRLRHHDHGAVAARVAHQGQADAGVAGRALHHRPAGGQRPAPLGIGDQVVPGTVLHRAAGVHELRLAEDGAAGGLRGAPQPDQRRVADCLDQPGLPACAVVSLCHCRLSPEE